MRYFVTGATGFIGGKLARRLRERGDQVVAIVRRPADAGDLAALGIEIHQGDITDKESMRGPMTGVDGVFHVAAWYKVGARDKRPAQSINVDGTRNVLTLMQELGIRKGVYTSTLAVNGDTHGQVYDETHVGGPPFVSEYDRTKWEAHHRVALPLMEAGLPLVIVMPGLVYGPGDTSTVRTNLVSYLTGTLPLMPARTAFCWAHVDDVVTGHLQAMDQGTPGESYMICGEIRTFVEAMRLAQRLTGIPTPRLIAPPALMRASAAIMGLIDGFVPLPPTFTGEGLRVAAGVTYLGTDAKARRELGFEPRPLEIGLKATLDHELALLGRRPPAAR